MSQVIDPRLFPGIDLYERSSRPGVDGPRYVPIPNDRDDGGYNLGDTNTGRTVFPTGRSSNWQPEDVFYSDNTQLADMVAITGNQVD